MIGVRARQGFSLAEVLISSFVMAVLMVPILFMFLSSAGSAGQDARELRASSLAQELMEQIITTELQNPLFAAVPSVNDAVADGAKEQELDVDKLVASFSAELGAPLFNTGLATQGTRLYLSPTEPGFHRFLAISPLRAGKSQNLLSAPMPFRVHVRVQFGTPLAGRELEKDVRLSTFLYHDRHRVDFDEGLE